jgi:hypothetical protein
MNQRYLDAIATTIMNLSDIGNNVFNFANSFRGKQIESKQWLVDSIPIEPKRVLILGSWYGTVLPHLLIEKYNIEHIDCVDSDPNVHFAAELFSRHMGYDQVHHHTRDAFEFLMVNGVDDYDLVINTSCEHMDDMRSWVEPNTTYALESNNYFGIEGHINCKKSLTLFENSTGLSHILYSNEKDMGNYKRYLVIGNA